MHRTITATHSNHSAIFFSYLYSEYSGTCVPTSVLGTSIALREYIDDISVKNLPEEKQLSN